ncbi:RagB/SusD family nutrient uptake outer membrane protein [Wenyingzhuangia sp. 2_MG-2023]|uniref:RagB/SusD family nutrient uptake outer membrane protein n=1 Tax=Wenyingzhuangia sp. 2_MG-2023 TaxID=3062639 RepID=UPI0026E266EF|nr:RagB/SusD family nutrient uptake outer membrane protein [Wenyingzhuangia sp. 2_MG-2023]MDO6736413.1 RagB/SusD family nutrient uptake outer membrane protein [Wenyingzhuangia sp. 2_MG-2023]
MMRNIYKIKIALLITLATQLVSCDDYLSELPDQRTLIDSPEKISQLITNAYPQSGYQLMAEIMSDNADDKGTTEETTDLELDSFRWITSNLDTNDTPASYWNSCYNAIAHANEALASIENFPETDLSAQKGEALLARAYGHFMLVNFWAKSYNSTTASTDLGIPYVLQPETVLLEEYTRNTVEEVYDLIEKDLIEGLALVTSDYDQPKYHFTKSAAYAFATRFYLYKGDWDKVIEHSSKVLTNPSNQIRNTEGYRSLTYSQNKAIYPSATETTNLLIVSTESLYDRRFASTRFGLSALKANELFFSGAGNPLSKSWSYAVYGTDVVYNLPKFDEYFKLTNANAGIGIPHVEIVLFSIDEVLLNRAEAYAMKEQYTEALADLDIFLSRKTRSYDATTDKLTDDIVKANYPIVTDEYTPSYSLLDNQTPYVKMIAELKRREFYHEGLRWFDIRRFDLEITHELSDRSVVVLEKQDPRKALQIPTFALAQGLTANPR